MYAIVFNLNTDLLARHYGDPLDGAYEGAYDEVRKLLQRHGFERQHANVYFGGEQVNAVTCVLAVRDLGLMLSWFSASVQDIRMLRIEEMNDLMPAV